MFLNKFFGAGATPNPCASCQDDDLLDFEVRMAFQPILDCANREVYAYEALVRGANGESAGEVIARVRPEQMYRFDQTCRVQAISTAARLGMQTRLSINFNPNAVYEPATCIRLTLAAARMTGFETGKLIFEVTETERVRDSTHLVKIFSDYQKRGFMTAIDDFGAGYAGLSLLAGFQPDLVKVDMALVRGIDQSAARRTIVAGLVDICRGLGCRVLAEGVETQEEYRVLRRLGIQLFQGYLFARPQLEALPDVEPALWEQLDERAGLSEAAA